MFFEIARAAEQIKPRYILLENVKGLLYHDKGNTFATVLSTLHELGYDVEWNVLNSKNFGVPQSRERESSLSDILESSVNQSYYLTDKILSEIVIDVDPKDIPPDSIPIREGIKLGYKFATVGDSVNIQRPKCKNRRGRVGDKICNTLQTSDTFAVVEEDLRMRKLTPLEFWRLQGFTDEQFDKAQQSGISNSQLYKQAGNAVTVNVVDYISKYLLRGDN